MKNLIIKIIQKGMRFYDRHLYEAGVKIADITSCCHKAGCWRDYAGRPICGFIKKSGYCCEKIQEKCYYKGQLVNARALNIRP